MVGDKGQREISVGRVARAPANQGSRQKKVQRDFEKPSFEEKTRFHPHVLDMSENQKAGAQCAPYNFLGT